MCDCGKEHEQINTKLDHIESTLEFHTAEVHGQLVDRETIRTWDGKLETEIEELADAVLGPRRSELAGGGRKHEEGLAWQWKHYTTNGGIPAKWGPKQWSAIVLAIITMFTSITIQLIEHWPAGSP